MVQRDIYKVIFLFLYLYIFIYIYINIYMYIYCFSDMYICLSLSVYIYIYIYTNYIYIYHIFITYCSYIYIYISPSSWKLGCVPRERLLACLLVCASACCPSGRAHHLSNCEDLAEIESNWIRLNWIDRMQRMQRNCYYGSFE